MTNSIGKRAATPRRQSGFARLLVAAWLLGAASTAPAQRVCSQAGESAHCHPVDVRSTTSQVGDLTYISRSDGSSAVMQRVGDISYITDSREGMSGVAQHVGDMLFLRLPLGDWVCSQVGPSLLCS